MKQKRLTAKWFARAVEQERRAGEYRNLTIKRNAEARWAKQDAERGGQ